MIKKKKNNKKSTKRVNTPLVAKTKEEGEPEYDYTQNETAKFGNPLSSNGVVSIQVTPQQMDNILNLKKASELTDVDELKFDNGRLRTMLELWSAQVVYEGKLYLIQVDPLNREVKMLDEEQS